MSSSVISACLLVLLLQTWGVLASHCSMFCRPEPKEIGFTATITPDLIPNLELGQTIIFNQIITNIGNAYDSDTGKFNVPISGTYLFNLSILAARYSYIEASLFVNGTEMVSTLSDQRDTSHWNMGTTNLIVRVDKGGIVNVAVRNAIGKATVHGLRFSTFSGYLLKAL